MGVENAGDDMGGMEIDLLEQKNAPDEFASIREEAVHILGKDFMTTKDLFEYFQQFNPKYVEWLNDSSANVVFEDASSAKRAIFNLRKEGSSELAANEETYNFREFSDGKPYSKSALDGTCKTVSDYHAFSIPWAHTRCNRENSCAFSVRAGQ